MPLPNAHRAPTRLPRATVLVLAVLTLAACGGGASASPAAATASAAATAPASIAPAPTTAPAATASPVPTDTPVVASSPSDAPSPSAGPTVHIDLPSGWQQVELTADALAAEINTIQASNPGLATSYQQLLDSGAFKGFLYYALDFEKLKNVGNINVTIVQAGGMSLDAASPLIEGEYKQLGATTVKFHHATVGGIDSLVVDYAIALKASGSTQPITGRGYFIPNGDNYYNVTTTCYGTVVAACIKDGDTMAAGMTVTP